MMIRVNLTNDPGSAEPSFHVILSTAAPLRGVYPEKDKPAKNLSF